MVMDICKAVTVLLIGRAVKYGNFPEITLFGQMDFISSTNALMIHIYLPMLAI